jgi:hypothetical protein
MKYIKQSNGLLTYGKSYQVAGYWGEFGDYIVIDDNGKMIQTFKHYFEDDEINNIKESKNAVEKAFNYIESDERNTLIMESHIYSLLNVINEMQESSRETKFKKEIHCWLGGEWDDFGIFDNKEDAEYGMFPKEYLHEALKEFKGKKVRMLVEVIDE